MAPDCASHQPLRQMMGTWISWSSKVWPCLKYLPCCLRWPRAGSSGLDVFIDSLYNRFASKRTDPVFSMATVKSWGGRPWRFRWCRGPSACCVLWCASPASHLTKLRLGDTLANSCCSNLISNKGTHTLYNDSASNILLASLEECPAIRTTQGCNGNLARLARWFL